MLIKISDCTNFSGDILYTRNKSDSERQVVKCNWWTVAYIYFNKTHLFNIQGFENGLVFSKTFNVGEVKAKSLSREISENFENVVDVTS